MKLLEALIVVLIIILPTKNTYAELYDNKPKADEVGLYFSGVAIPLDKIMLIRKNNRYCAMKFVRTWFEMDEERLKAHADDIKMGGISAESAKESAQKSYATYESYFDVDGTPDFSGQRIQRIIGTATLLPLRGPFRPFVYQPGNGCVECGPFKLSWAYKTFVSFIPVGKGENERDYGIELAPTIWSDIKDININDNRIKWYRYDEKKERVFIPIDKFWEQ